MNTDPQFSKRCYRCNTVVRMTADEFRADANEYTCCQVCHDKLTVEAGFVGTPITIENIREHLPPKNEAEVSAIIAVTRDVPLPAPVPFARPGQPIPEKSTD